MITLGPYTFTDNDARRTLSNLGGMWSDMMDGRDSRTCDELEAGLTERLRVALGVHDATDLGGLGNLGSQQLPGSHLPQGGLAGAWTPPREAPLKLPAAGR